MLKHLYKSHVRESLSPHQDKIQFSKSPNHYPNNTEVQLVYKSLSFGGWLYYTVFKLDTISHPYHSNCAFQSLVKNQQFCDQPWGFTGGFEFMAHSSMAHENGHQTHGLMFFFVVWFGSLKPKVQKSVPGVFWCGFTLVQCSFVAEAAIQDHLKVLHPENGLNKTWAT